MSGETLRGVAMGVAALLPPAIAVFRHPGHGLRLTERALLALALAPIALAVTALALGLSLRLPVDWALWQAEFVWVVAALWPRARAGAVPPVEPLPARGEGFPSLAALGGALVAAALVAGVAFTVPMVRMWSDAWFHAGAAIEIARRGVPPEDPNFAGVPLHYAWFYHYLLALLGAAGRLSPFHAMAFVNAWAAVVTALAAAQLAYRAAGRGAAVWVGLIVVLGLDPFGWVLWVARGVVGETTGLGPMLAQFGSTNGAANALSWNFPPSHASLLNRFWTGTALTPAIALGLVTAWSVARGLERPSRGAWLRTLLVALAAYAIHPAYAAFAVAAVAAALPFAARGGAAAAGWAQGAALVLATGAGFAWIRACSVPGATTAIQLGLYARNLGSLALAVGPWWALIVPGARAAWRHGAAGRAAVAAAAAAVAASLLVVLPEFNSDKLFYLAWVSLAPLAAAGVAWGGDRLRLPGIARLTLLAALIVPSAGLYTLGTAADRRSPRVLVAGDTPEARRHPLATVPEEAAYRLLREGTPPDAVVIESPRPTVNEPVPVLAERRVFCGSLDVYLSNHFDGGAPPGPAMRALLEEFGVRRGIQRTLFSDGGISGPQALYLSGFSAPLYLLVRREDVAHDVWTGFRRRPEWDELLANEQVRVYRYVPGPPPTSR